MDADDEEQPEDANRYQQGKSSPFLLNALLDAFDNKDPSCQPGSQAQPLEISSSDKSDGEPRRSGCAKRPSRTVQSQQWQIEHGVIPVPGAKAKVRALNAKKKQNTKESQLDHEFKFKLIE
jgi:hypothetical protein